MRNRGFLFAFYGSFKHTVVLKKTLDVFEKTLDVFKNSSDVFFKTTVCLKVLSLLKCKSLRINLIDIC